MPSLRRRQRCVGMHGPCLPHHWWRDTMTPWTHEESMRRALSSRHVLIQAWFFSCWSLIKYHNPHSFSSYLLLLPSYLDQVNDNQYVDRMTVPRTHSIANILEPLEFLARSRQVFNLQTYRNLTCYTSVHMLSRHTTKVSMSRCIELSYNCHLLWLHREPSHYHHIVLYPTSFQLHTTNRRHQAGLWNESKRLV